MLEMQVAEQGDGLRHFRLQRRNVIRDRCREKGELPAPFARDFERGSIVKIDQNGSNRFRNLLGGH
jgi:ribosomal protein L21E